jgi:hypothetical protein
MMPTFQQLFMSGAFTCGKWISETDAAKAVQARYPDLPFGRALKTARDIAKAGDVPPLPIETEWIEDWVRGADGKRLPARVRVVDKTPRPTYWLREDFLYLLEHHKAPGMKPATGIGKARGESKRPTAKLLNQVWAEFEKSEIHRTQAEFVKFGRNEPFRITDQEALRQKYRNCTGNLGPGRRRINRKK